MLYKISFSEYEEQYQHDLDIEIVPQDYLGSNPAPIPNQKPKWPENLIEAAGNVVGDPDDRKRMRPQYQNEHVALSHTVSLPLMRCNKIPERCYLMVSTDPQFDQLKNKLDQVTIPPERRDKDKKPSPIYH